MLGAVVGIELTIARLEGKWKTSQNQPPRNQQSVIDGLQAAGEENLARLMKDMQA